MAEKKLNQILAVERDIKSRAYKDLTKEHHLLQKPAMVQGLSRTYTPKHDDGERYPDETTLVQLRVKEVLREVQERQREFFDITLTKDNANRLTSGDIVLDDGTTIATNVPAPFLLFLEKQLGDMHVFVSKLPTLDPAKSWTWDSARGLYVTQPVQTIKTKKVKKSHVAVQPTDKHPAQVQFYDDDEVVGHWTQVEHSGALPPERKAELVRRVEQMQKAVKEARERANLVEAPERKIADTLFNFLFKD